jgi:hypothetical protein
MHTKGVVRWFPLDGLEEHEWLMGKHNTYKEFMWIHNKLIRMDEFYGTPKFMPNWQAMYLDHLKLKKLEQLRDDNIFEVAPPVTCPPTVPKFVTFKTRRKRRFHDSPRVVTGHEMFVAEEYFTLSDPSKFVVEYDRGSVTADAMEAAKRKAKQAWRLGKYYPVSTKKPRRPTMYDDYVVKPSVCGGYGNVMYGDTPRHYESKDIGWNRETVYFTRHWPIKAPYEDGWDSFSPVPSKEAIELKSKMVTESYSHKPRLSS